jgi:hypothetical protein
MNKHRLPRISGFWVCLSAGTGAGDLDENGYPSLNKRCLESRQ